MSKAQSTTAFNTGNATQATDQGNSQSSYNAAQDDVGNYEDQLAKFSAANPYTQGGQFQTAQNTQLADTAAAGSQAAAQAVQSAAVRSGQNPAAGIAATEQIAQQQQRNLAGEQADATTSRIASGAGYGNQVLGASAKPEEMEQQLSSTEGQLAGGALGDETKAAAVPSFTDELLSAGAGALGKAAGGAIIGCWIAARLWGGWGDMRTIKVRLWLQYHVAPRGGLGGIFAWAYQKWGRAIAEQMPKSPALTAVCGAVFGRLRKAAERWVAGSSGAAYYERHWLLLKDNEDSGYLDRDERWHRWAIAEAGRLPANVDPRAETKAQDNQRAVA